jgi:putative SOS response-associated peptidase YedK
MCGRYVLEAPEDLSERFHVRQVAFNFRPTFNAAPSQLLPVIVEAAPEVWEARLMHWGLIPRWKNSGKPLPPPINARAESVDEKPMFRGLVTKRRCLVPASGFYEWQARGAGERKQPYFIHVADEPLFAFAGLWDETRPEGADDVVAGSFTIVTTAANEAMSSLHHRMPVILDRSDEATWVSTELQEASAVMPLLRPLPSERIAAFPVSLAINNVRNDEPELIEPIDGGEDEDGAGQPSLF